MPTIRHRTSWPLPRYEDTLRHLPWPVRVHAHEYVHVYVCVCARLHIIYFSLLQIEKDNFEKLLIQNGIAVPDKRRGSKQSLVSGVLTSLSLHSPLTNVSPPPPPPPLVGRWW